MREPDTWSVERLCSEELGVTAVWASPSVRSRVEQRLPFPQRLLLAELEPDTRTLIVAGGGTLIDQSKAWRRDHAPSMRLVAIASIWGSGAEASPIVVLNEKRGKTIRMDPAYVPDVRVLWPELADSLPPLQARRACGDAWSHALEGYFSPLLAADLREEGARLIGKMLELSIGHDREWFEASVAACRLQARSSVGLVHGIAHTLEGPLVEAQPEFGWGHAALCSTFLWPVLSLNATISSKNTDLLVQNGLDAGAIFATARSLFEPEAYERALPLLESQWNAVLRDPSTRTNSALIRPGHLEHFRRREFPQ